MYVIACIKDYYEPKTIGSNCEKDEDGWRVEVMSGWAKGSLAEALDSVTKARGSCLRLVNCAYTSQMDSNTCRLEGRRVGDKFHHVNGDVSHADTNAAVNIKHRGDDTEITRYTPYKKVKTILLNRLSAVGGVSDHFDRDRPSRTPVAYEKSASTESELPIKSEIRIHYSRL